MGETLADIARRDEAHTPTKLVVKHTGDGAPHRSKIVIDKLNFFYGRIQALKQVCLTLKEHQVTGMIGPSGCGKSTVLRVLSRIYSMYPAQRATGTVELDGSDVIGPAVNLKWLRSRVGMVFQEITVFPMSIAGNVSFGTSLHESLSRAEMAARVEETLVRAALWDEVKDRLHGPASALSRGQQQRLSIARALSTRPEVLLLDEPTSALDPLSMRKIEDLIDDPKKTITIVLVTHNMQKAARCADQVAFFFLGEMMRPGRPSRCSLRQDCHRRRPTSPAGSADRLTASRPSTLESMTSPTRAPASGWPKLKSTSTRLKIGAATALLAEYGKNDPAAAKRRPLALQFLARFRNPLIIILLAASALSAAIGDVPSFVIFACIILLTAIKGRIRNLPVTRPD